LQISLRDTLILKRFTKFSDFTVKTPYKRRTVREIRERKRFNKGRIAYDITFV